MDDATGIERVKRRGGFDALPQQVGVALVLENRHAVLPCQSEQALEAEFLRRIPLGHLVTPGDLAGTYVYLASDLSRYTTGQSLTVDGGWQLY